MDIGSGLAIGVPSIAVAGTICSVVKTLKNGKNKTCAVHDLVVKSIDEVKISINEVRNDVKELLKRGD
jgi:hypothetical protein